MESRTHIKLLIEVSRLYWIEGRSQAEVAQIVGYSRSMVSRLLTEARQRGIITFHIHHPLERAIESEERMRKRFGLRDVKISSGDTDEAPSEVARLAADLLRDLVTQDSVIAISNGRAVSAVVRELRSMRRPHVTAVQALGTLSQENQMLDSTELCRMFAQRLGGRYRLLPAPLVVGSEALATALRAEESVAVTLTMASHADVLLTGVGETQSRKPGQIFHGLIKPAEHEALLRSGSVGHLCGHHFDARGHHIDNDFCRRLIAVPHDRLREVPNVVAVAWGAEKVLAIRGALRGGMIDTLVTDVATAEAVLAAE